MNDKKLSFHVYFLKEGTRVYDKPNLMSYLSSNPNITLKESENVSVEQAYIYHHNILNFEAEFILSKRTAIPDLQNLDARYYDTNFYVSFNVLLPDYAAELIVDIVEEICKRYSFKMYVESFKNSIKSFNRAELLNTFRHWKKAYAETNAIAVAQFNKLDRQTLAQVYSYLQTKKRLEITYEPSKIQISNYYFLYAEGSRTAFVAIKWDGEKPFILPPAVDILLLDDGKVQKYIPVIQILEKAEKYFTAIDGFGAINKLEPKYVSKLHKLLIKEKFSPLSADLKSLSLDRILDI